MSRVFVAGGNPESRALLRGLLRLHHHEVTGESESLESVARKSGAASPNVILVDGSARGWADITTRAGALWPRAKVVLVAPPSESGKPPALEPAVPAQVLPRPFRVEEFLRAVDGPADRSGAYASDSPQPNSP
ncbi:MAG: PRCC domain-containing protein [Thermoplasmata archaeon]|nr:PRCC domain-containing protein [Thermoplasmata archaeon]